MRLGKGEQVRDVCVSPGANAPASFPASPKCASNFFFFYHIINERTLQ